MEKLRFISFASGSTGNCFFIGNGFEGILIDAGIGIRSIRKGLKNIGLDFANILGVFVTHDHFDHIKAVAPLTEKFHVPMYATLPVYQRLSQGAIAPQCILEKEVPVHLHDWEITAFEVSHDGTDNVGYTIQYRQQTFTLLTDLGFICERAARHIAMADYLVIEANYDEQMLEQSAYPDYLKNRIRSKTGHMSNADTAHFLSNHFPEKLKSVFLCHLSHFNNLPDLAYCTVSESFEQKGIVVGRDVELYTLDRNLPSQLFVFS
ncbi:MAG: MBL fold metallo-hydrolase [Microbacter sp.]